MTVMAGLASRVRARPVTTWTSAPSTSILMTSTRADVGQEVVEPDRLHLDDLLGVAQPGQGVGSDGAHARVAGEVPPHVELQLRRLRPRGPVPRRDVGVEPVDDDVALEQLGQTGVGLDGDDTGPRGPTSMPPRRVK